MLLGFSLLILHVAFSLGVAVSLRRRCVLDVLLRRYFYVFSLFVGFSCLGVAALRFVAIGRRFVILISVFTPAPQLFFVFSLTFWLCLSFRPFSLGLFEFRIDFHCCYLSCWVAR